MTTLAPRAANRADRARPTPEAAPVTIAVRSLHSSSTRIGMDYHRFLELLAEAPNPIELPV